jgi:RNA polymerase sigma-70 factor, ECF subfamily
MGGRDAHPEAQPIPPGDGGKVRTLAPSDPLVELVWACARGEERALARLYRLAAPRLFALALAILKDRSSAEEALQESFISIWGSAHRFAPERGSVMTWMVTIVRNRALTMLRRRRPQAEAVAAAENVPAREPDPLESALRSSALHALATCLDQLDPQQRLAIQLAYLQGYTHQELALRLSAPLGTIKSWIRRGLIRLRDCLDHG